MKDGRFKYIKNLKLREQNLTYLSIGMILVGSIMLGTDNTTELVGASLIYSGLYTASLAQEYWMHANTVIGENKEKIKKK